MDNNGSFNPNTQYLLDEDHEKEPLLEVNGTETYKSELTSRGYVPEPHLASPVVDMGVTNQNIGMVAPKATPAMFRGVRHSVY